MVSGFTVGGLGDLLFVMLVCFVDEEVQLVVEELVPQDVALGGAEFVILEGLLDPLFERVHAHDGAVGALLLEVGIFHAVAGVRQGYSRRVCSEFLDGFAESQEVAGRFAHFGTVEKEMAV